MRVGHKRGGPVGIVPISASEPASGARADRVRIRAAWMYFVEQMTQNDIAEVLGIGRVSVVRLLAEARSRNEVMVAIEGDLPDIISLERQLERRFDIAEVIVAPLSGADVDPVPSISVATGRYLSQAMQSGMTVGVGWGRTLFGSLAFLNRRSLQNFRVISLLGGVSKVRRSNPAEFAWRFAEAFQGEGFLIPAPAVVDSVATKEALIERCGIRDILELSDGLDAVILSVGDMASATQPYRGGFVSEAQRLELMRLGGVGDVLFHFYDGQGRVLAHPLNELVMSVDVERLRRAPMRILASGGSEKIAALLGAIMLLKPTVVITDEHAARAMLGAGA